MKGLSHFMIGVAAASCFPEAVAAGARGDPLYFVLAGCCGLLPDTLDFKLTRFLYRCDIMITPDPNDPDPAPIAQAVADAIHAVRATGRPIDLKLNTIQLGADRWRRYTLNFDVPGRRVRVAIGPAVDTGGRVLPGEPAPERRAFAPLACDVAIDYLATTTIDILDGPVFRFERGADARVRPVFIPWHRSWTHSIVPALLLALAGAATWNILAGCVIFAAYAAHIAADQMGYLGSNLFAPFTRRRAPGLKWTHAMHAFPNFLAVWGSILVIFWNLAAQRAGHSPGLNLLRYVALAGVLPLGLFYWLQRGEQD